MQRISLGDIIRLKKAHPCGENKWEVLRVGADFRLKCLGCGRLLLLPRSKVEKSVKEVLCRSADAAGSSQSASNG